MKKRMSLISMLLIGTLMTAALTGCGKDASETNNRESINQVSLLKRHKMKRNETKMTLNAPLTSHIAYFNLFLGVILL